MPEEQTETTCATHPDVVTYLRCGKCDKPICPRCLVHSPVGPRCRACAQLRRLPVFEVSPLQYLRAAGAGLGIGLAGGLLWGFIPFGGFVSFFLSPIIGYFVGEGTSRAANRRQSLGLKVLAGLGVFLAYVVSRIGPTFLVAGALLLAGAPGPLVSLFVSAVLATLLNPIAWIVIAIGVYIAVGRIG